MLTDFGVTRILQEVPTGLTTGQMHQGTIAYLCPEAVLTENSGWVLSRDVWAWGCVCLFVCIGGFCEEGDETDEAESPVRSSPAKPRTRVYHLTYP